jgi:hypothetical protein
MTCILSSALNFHSSNTEVAKQLIGRDGKALSRMSFVSGADDQAYNSEMKVLALFRFHRDSGTQNVGWRAPESQQELSVKVSCAVRKFFLTLFISNQIRITQIP